MAAREMGGLVTEVLGAGIAPAVRLHFPSPCITNHPLTSCRREGASELLDAYFESNGGRAAIEEEAGQAALAKIQETDLNTQPWEPPRGSWDDNIDEIRLVGEEDQRRVGYVWWMNNQVTRFPAHVLHRHAPQTVSAERNSPSKSRLKLIRSTC
jgi:hypothetical protein